VRAVAIIALGMVACGGHAVSDGPGHVRFVDDAGDGDVHVPKEDPDAADGATALDASPDRVAADSAGEVDAAAPTETCESQVGGAFNCCDGLACRGYCQERGGCACGFVKGGCPPPLICCDGTCCATDGI
jgi:hypothetical protein